MSIVQSFVIVQDAAQTSKCLEGVAAIWEMVPDIVPPYHPVTIIHDIPPRLSPAVHLLIGH